MHTHTYFYYVDDVDQIKSRIIKKIVLNCEPGYYFLSSVVKRYESITDFLSKRYYFSF